MAESSVARTEAWRDCWWLFHILSAVMSALAIVALARRAFETGSLSAPLALVMDVHDTTMRVLLGWAEPYLAWLGGYIALGPKLYPHWRDIFVVMFLVWAARFRVNRNYFLFGVSITFRCTPRLQRALSRLAGWARCKW